VLIVGEDPRIRRLIRDRVPSALIVGESHSARDAIATAHEHQAQLVVLDATLLDGAALALAERLIHDANAKVVLLCGPGQGDLPFAALRKGVLGCVDKRRDLSSLHFVTREVGEGRAALSPSIVCDLARRLRALPEAQVGMRPVRSVLTGREWETVDQLCLGRSTREMAAALGLSVATVRMHIKNIMRKLDVHSRAEIVEVAGTLRAREAFAHAALAAAATDSR
jgi:two-component system nitrate/nitrite response regulator NarL